MNAYNPLAAMKRPEEAGSARAQAEAIVSEVGESRSELVTKEHLDTALEVALDKFTVRIGVIVAAMLTLFCTIIGTLVSVFATH